MSRPEYFVKPGLKAGLTWRAGLTWLGWVCPDCLSTSQLGGALGWGYQAGMGGGLRPSVAWLGSG